MDHKIITPLTEPKLKKKEHTPDTPHTQDNVDYIHITCSTITAVKCGERAQFSPESSLIND